MTLEGLVLEQRQTRRQYGRTIVVRTHYPLVVMADVLDLMGDVCWELGEEHIDSLWKVFDQGKAIEHHERDECYLWSIVSKDDLTNEPSSIPIIDVVGKDDVSPPLSA